MCITVNLMNFDSNLNLINKIFNVSVVQINGFKNWPKDENSRATREQNSTTITLEII